MNLPSLHVSTLLEFSHAASARRTLAAASSALMLWMKFNWVNFGLQIPPSAFKFISSTETLAVQKTGQIIHTFLPRCSGNVSILGFQHQYFQNVSVYIWYPSFASLHSCYKCQQWQIKSKSNHIYYSEPKITAIICPRGLYNVHSCDPPSVLITSHRVRKNWKKKI